MGPRRRAMLGAANAFSAPDLDPWIRRFADEMRLIILVPTDDPVAAARLDETMRPVVDAAIKESLQYEHKLANTLGMVRDRATPRQRIVLYLQNVCGVDLGVDASDWSHLLPRR